MHPEPPPLTLKACLAGKQHVLSSEMTKPTPTRYDAVAAKVIPTNRKAVYEHPHLLVARYERDESKAVPSRSGSCHHGART
jgi:hypothetical protein